MYVELTSSIAVSLASPGNSGNCWNCIALDGATIRQIIRISQQKLSPFSVD